MSDKMVILNTCEFVKEICIDKEDIGILIGFQAVNLKMIEDSTGAKISINGIADPKLQKCQLLISGTEFAVKKSEKLIEEILNEKLNHVSETLYVHDIFCSKLSGQHNQIMVEISRLSKTQLKADFFTKIGGNFCPIIITGSPANIQSAKYLLLKRMEELKIANEITKLEQELYTLIFVSAVETPEHFWVQFIDPKNNELESLMKNMLECYNNNNGNNLLSLQLKAESVKLGDMYAADLEGDGNWYRVLITDVYSTEVDVYCVDYGNSLLLPFHTLRPLKSEFLNLSFQATECLLSNIKPYDGNWSEEAISTFESLVQVGNWHPLMCKVIGYQQNMYGTLPSLVIIDTNDNKNINIGQKLVDLNFAKNCNFTSNMKTKTRFKPKFPQISHSSEKAIITSNNNMNKPSKFNLNKSVNYNSIKDEQSNTFQIQKSLKKILKESKKCNIKEKNCESLNLDKDKISRLLNADSTDNCMPLYYGFCDEEDTYNNDTDNNKDFNLELNNFEPIKLNNVGIVDQNVNEICISNINMSIDDFKNQSYNTIAENVNTKKIIRDSNDKDQLKKALVTENQICKNSEKKQNVTTVNKIKDKKIANTSVANTGIVIENKSAKIISLNNSFVDDCYLDNPITTIPNDNDTFDKKHNLANIQPKENNSVKTSKFKSPNTETVVTEVDQKSSYGSHEPIGSNNTLNKGLYIPKNNKEKFLSVKQLSKTCNFEEFPCLDEIKTFNRVIEDFQKSNKSLDVVAENILFNNAIFNKFNEKDKQIKSDNILTYISPISIKESVLLPKNDKNKKQMTTNIIADYETNCGSQLSKASNLEDFPCLNEMKVLNSAIDNFRKSNKLLDVVGENILFNKTILNNTIIDEIINESEGQLKGHNVLNNTSPTSYKKSDLVPQNEEGKVQMTNSLITDFPSIEQLVNANNVLISSINVYEDKMITDNGSLIKEYPCLYDLIGLNQSHKNIIQSKNNAEVKIDKVVPEVLNPFVNKDKMKIEVEKENQVPVLIKKMENKKHRNRDEVKPSMVNSHAIKVTSWKTNTSEKSDLSSNMDANNTMVDQTEMEVYFYQDGREVLKKLENGDIRLKNNYICHLDVDEVCKTIQANSDLAKKSFSQPKDKPKISRSVIKIESKKQDTNIHYKDPRLFFHSLLQRFDEDIYPAIAIDCQDEDLADFVTVKSRKRNNKHLDSEGFSDIENSFNNPSNVENICVYNVDSSKNPLDLSIDELVNYIEGNQEKGAVIICKRNKNRAPIIHSDAIKSKLVVPSYTLCNMKFHNLMMNQIDFTCYSDDENHDDFIKVKTKHHKRFKKEISLNNYNSSVKESNDSIYGATNDNLNIEYLPNVEKSNDPLLDYLSRDLESILNHQQSLRMLDKVDNGKSFKKLSYIGNLDIETILRIINPNKDINKEIHNKLNLNLHHHKKDAHKSHSSTEHKIGHQYSIPHLTFENLKQHHDEDLYPTHDLDQDLNSNDFQVIKSKRHFRSLRNLSELVDSNISEESLFIPIETQDIMNEELLNLTVDDLVLFIEGNNKKGKAKIDGAQEKHLINTPQKESAKVYKQLKLASNECKHKDIKYEPIIDLSLRHPDVDINDLQLSREYNFGLHILEKIETGKINKKFCPLSSLDIDSIVNYIGDKDSSHTSSSYPKSCAKKHGKFSHKLNDATPLICAYILPKLTLQNLILHGDDDLYPSHVDDAVDEDESGFCEIHKKRKRSRLSSSVNDNKDIDNSCSNSVSTSENLIPQSVENLNIRIPAVENEENLLKTISNDIENLNMNSHQYVDNLTNIKNELNSIKRSIINLTTADKHLFNTFENCKNLNDDLFNCTKFAATENVTQTITFVANKISGEEFLEKPVFLVEMNKNDLCAGKESVKKIGLDLINVKLNATKVQDQCVNMAKQKHLKCEVKSIEVNENELFIHDKNVSPISTNLSKFELKESNVGSHQFNKASEGEFNILGTTIEKLIHNSEKNIKKETDIDIVNSGAQVCNSSKNSKDYSDIPVDFIENYFSEEVKIKTDSNDVVDTINNNGNAIDYKKSNSRNGFKDTKQTEDGKNQLKYRKVVGKINSSKKELINGLPKEEIDSKLDDKIDLKEIEINDIISKKAKNTENPVLRIIDQEKVLKVTKKNEITKEVNKDTHILKEFSHPIKPIDGQTEDVEDKERNIAKNFEKKKNPEKKSLNFNESKNKVVNEEVQNKGMVKTKSTLNYSNAVRDNRQLEKDDNDNRLNLYINDNDKNLESIKKDNKENKHVQCKEVKINKAKNNKNANKQAEETMISKMDKNVAVTTQPSCGTQHPDITKNININHLTPVNGQTSNSKDVLPARDQIINDNKISIPSSSSAIPIPIEENNPIKNVAFSNANISNKKVKQPIEFLRKSSSTETEINGVAVREKNIEDSFVELSISEPKNGNSLNVTPSSKMKRKHNKIVTANEKATSNENLPTIESKNLASFINKNAKAIDTKNVTMDNRNVMNATDLNLESSIINIKTEDMLHSNIKKKKVPTATLR